MPSLPKRTPLRNRPGTEILESERLAAMLGDVVDGLEALQAQTPHAGIETLLDTIRFVRARLIKCAEEALR